MKVRSLFYLITLFCTTLSGCQKEEIDFGKISGRWYVERCTTFDGAPGSNDYTLISNYEAVGIFNFHENGTGEYTFDNQVTPFTYTITENTNSYNNTSSFNGITISGGASINDNVINLTFDKSQIISPTSPIVTVYDVFGLERYEVFTRTKNTLRFRGSYGYNSGYSTPRNIEFILTRL